MMLEIWFGLSLTFLLCIGAIILGILVAEETDIQSHRNKEEDDDE